MHQEIFLGKILLAEAMVIICNQFNKLMTVDTSSGVFHILTSLETRPKIAEAKVADLIIG